MSDGASNKSKAGAKAAALSAKVNEVSEDSSLILEHEKPDPTPVHTEESAQESRESALAAARKAMLDAENILKSLEPPEEVKSESKEPILAKMYDIVGADYITGVSTRIEDQNIAVLKGRVTDADLDAAQVDKAWLLKTGAIVDAGWDYV